MEPLARSGLRLPIIIEDLLGIEINGNNVAKSIETLIS